MRRARSPSRTPPRSWPTWSRKPPRWRPSPDRPLQRADRSPAATRPGLTTPGRNVGVASRDGGRAGMPATGESDDLTDLKAALLNFVVREVRDHAGELGPLSDDITRAIADGAGKAVADSLREFEASRLERLTEALWARIGPELRSRTEALSGELSASLAESLGNLSTELRRQVAEEAR